MLRWKDRPLQCPRCQSLNVGPWGTYHHQSGLQRYRCKETGCQRTFNDLTGTLLDGSKRSPAHWILATFLLCLSCSSRRIAKELGVHVRTGGRSRKLLLAGCAKIVFGMPRLIVDLDLVEVALYTAPHVSNMRASEGLVR
jgi:transposase-like protein